MTEFDEQLEVLQKKTDAVLARFIREKYKEMLAGALAYMSPEARNGLLAELPQNERIALESLSRGLSPLDEKVELLASTIFAYEGWTGLEDMAAVLNAKGPGYEEEYHQLEAFAENNPVFGERLKRMHQSFKLVTCYDDWAIQKVLREVDMNVLAEALTFSDDEIQEKFFKNMSKRSGAMLAEMLKKNSVTSRQSNQSKRAIMAMLFRLCEAGEIVPPVLSFDNP